MLRKMKRILCQVRPTNAFSTCPILKDKIPIHTCSLAPLSYFTHLAIYLLPQPQLLSWVSKEKMLNLLLDSCSCDSLPLSKTLLH